MKESIRHKDFLKMIMALTTTLFGEQVVDRFPVSVLLCGSRNQHGHFIPVRSVLRVFDFVQRLQQRDNPAVQVRREGGLPPHGTREDRRSYRAKGSGTLLPWPHSAPMVSEYVLGVSEDPYRLLSLVRKAGVHENKSCH